MALEVYSPGGVNGQGPTQDFNMDGQVTDFDIDAAAKGGLGALSDAYNGLSNSEMFGYGGTLAGMLGLGSVAGPVGSAIGNAIDLSNANDSIAAADNTAGLGLGLGDYLGGLAHSLSFGLLGESVNAARDRSLNTIAINGLMGLPGLSFDASDIDSDSLSFDLGTLAGGEVAGDLDGDGGSFSVDTSGDQGGPDVGGPDGVDGSAGFGAGADAGGWYAHGGLVRHWFNR